MDGDGDDLANPMVATATDDGGCNGGTADWADSAGEGERKREVLGRLSAQSQKRLLKNLFLFKLFMK